MDGAEERRVGEDQPVVGGLAGEAGQRRFETFEVVVGEEARVGEELGEVGVTDRPSELARVCENVFKGTNTAPTRAAAKAAIAKSTRFGIRIPTREPLPMPAASRPRARAAERASAAA